MKEWKRQNFGDCVIILYAPILNNYNEWEIFGMVEDITTNNFDTFNMTIYNVMFDCGEIVPKYAYIKIIKLWKELFKKKG